MIEVTHNPVSLLLQSKTSNIGPIEFDKKVAWAWAMGGHSRIDVHSVRAVRIHLQAPIPRSRISLTVDGKTVEERVTSRPWEALKGEWTGTVFEVACDQWNNENGRFFTTDLRPLSVLIVAFSEINRTDAASYPLSRENRICLYPFARMESNFSGFTPCCRRWFVPEYFRFEAGEDPWNGPAAQELRASILDGSYRWCDRTVCPIPLFDRSDLEGEKRNLGYLSVAPENLLAIRHGATEMPAGPTSLTFTSDPRCNLACPSCRPEKIVHLSESEKSEIQQLERYLERYRGSFRKLTFSTYGEVFFSPWLREQLSRATSARFPNLEFIEILSNGVLFDQESLDALRPGSDFIRRVGISIDAGNESTYRRVRGGDWSRLQKNLRWISKLRSTGRFTWFSIQFVVRRENWKSLDEFFTLAEDLGVDEVVLRRLQKWDYTNLDYQAENITESADPEALLFQESWARLNKRRWNFSINENLSKKIGCAPLESQPLS